MADSCTGDEDIDEEEDTDAAAALKAANAIIPCQVCKQTIQGETKYLEHLNSREHRSKYFRHIDLETERPYVELLDDFLK